MPTGPGLGDGQPGPVPPKRQPRLQGRVSGLPPFEGDSRFPSRFLAHPFPPSLSLGLQALSCPGPSSSRGRAQRAGSGVRSRCRDAAIQAADGRAERLPSREAAKIQALLKCPGLLLFRLLQSTVLISMKGSSSQPGNGDVLARTQLSRRCRPSRKQTPDRAEAPADPGRSAQAGGPAHLQPLRCKTGAAGCFCKHGSPFPYKKPLLCICSLLNAFVTGRAPLCFSFRSVHFV